MAVPAAPEAVEVGGGLAGFLAAVGCFTLWLLWRFSIGFVILRLADLLAATKIPIPHFGDVEVFGFAASALRKIDRNVNNALWQSMVASEHFGVWLFLQAGQQTAATSSAVYDGMVATGEALGRLERTYLPWMFRSHVGPITKSLGTVKAQAKTMDKTLHKMTAQTKATAKVAHNTATVALPRVEHGSRTRDKTLQKDLDWVRSRFKIGVFAALVGTALGKLGLRWLRCGNVNKVGKAVCGMNAGILEQLLLDAALLTVAFNLEQFARELQTVTGEAARVIHNFAD